MDHDDRQIGRLLTRREALTALGATGALLLLRCSSGGSAAADDGEDDDLPLGCVVRPQQTEGPYFVDELLNRSDIRSDPASGAARPGTPLELTFNVTRVAGAACVPLAGVVVDVWHCDHLGVYSDVEDPGFNTVGQKFLRGYQVTDDDGVARFTTVFPGWYQGRTVHIHFKLRSEPEADPGFEFTSQLYFDDAFTDRIHAREPYSDKGQRSVRNAGDGIYARGGSQLTVPVTEEDDGLAAAFDIALQIA
ncbi:MAG TPA: intradiol ring-cleavage dioxygenase [Gemmatimonadota bacterium]|nr:intradiol ring-cleavage dioxygenase [Gemmatimonadota bacterium]